MSSMDIESMVTVVAASTGISETLPVSLGTTTVGELAEWCTGLFGLQGSVQLLKDGQPLDHHMKLEQAGVINGDLLAAQETRETAAPQRPAVAGPPAVAAAPAAGGGALDFSNLLQSAPETASASGYGGGGGGGAGGGGLDFTNLLVPQMFANLTPQNAEPVYYPGMSLADAQAHNTNPELIVKLLQSKDHLFKELAHRAPYLAEKLRGQPYEAAVKIWREHSLKVGIMHGTKAFLSKNKEQEFRRRLEKDPNNAEAKNYFDELNRQRIADEQYHLVSEEYPESLGRILMLYIEAKVNGHSVQAFVDSGAQSTIMSKKTATLCGLMGMLDTRFKGLAVGVGTSKILGKVHIVQLQLSDYYFPCTITIMDDPPPGIEAKDMPFLLGLDMLKRHTCCIDLENQVLKFRLAPGKYLEAPFLHEKDLDESQGGTKGFNADTANRENIEQQRKYEEDGPKDDEDD